MEGIQNNIFEKRVCDGAFGWSYQKRIFAEDLGPFDLNVLMMISFNYFINQCFIMILVFGFLK